MAKPSFGPYIVRNCFVRDVVYDFHIENETAHRWYGQTADQYLPERGWCLDHLKPGLTVIDALITGA
jgi:hypothetical protein